MIRHSSFLEHAAYLREVMGHNAMGEEEFNAAALSLFALQFENNGAYRRFCQARKVTPTDVMHWSEIPAVPTVAFKELEMTSLPACGRPRFFRSSGTTGQQASRHFHNAESLELYEASLLPWFQKHLLPGQTKCDFLALSPPPEGAPHSSLAHMFATVQQKFGAANPVFTGKVRNDGAWDLNLVKTLETLRQAVTSGRPVCLLGTAFNFIHLLDHLVESGRRLQLPAGSRVLETGGYKGRSRELPKAELYALITGWLGIPGSHIVCEYGMSELSSQGYDAVAGAGQGTGRVFRFPVWARARVVSPETGREAGEGEMGLIRIFDLANAWSVMAVQTEDLGIRRTGGFELLGRAAQAEPRGCSLMSLAPAP